MIRLITKRDPDGQAEIRDDDPEKIELSFSRGYCEDSKKIEALNVILETSSERLSGRKPRFIAVPHHLMALELNPSLSELQRSFSYLPAPVYSYLASPPGLYPHRRRSHSSSSERTSHTPHRLAGPALGPPDHLCTYRCAGTDVYASIIAWNTLILNSAKNCQAYEYQSMTSDCGDLLDFSQF